MEMIENQIMKKKRIFNRQELMLFSLYLLNISPNHGYGLMKSFEDYSNGCYIPSAGVMYPALTDLLNNAYISESCEQSNRRIFSITQEGIHFLQTRSKQLQIAKEKINHLIYACHHSRIPEIETAFDLLKFKLRVKQRAAPLTPEQIEEIAKVITSAALLVEKV